MNATDLSPSGDSLLRPEHSKPSGKPKSPRRLDATREGTGGDVSAEDRAENELSLREGFRLLSVYQTASGTRFWIITEADRSATTVLLPEEY